MNTEIREVPPRWISVLRLASERKTWLRGPRPAVIYVDAAGCGNLGSVLLVGDRRLAFSTHIPEWVAREKCGIFKMEMRACVMGMCILAELYPGRSALLRCDSMGATGTLVRGDCHSPVSLVICGAFWYLASSENVPVWIEGVASKLNPSDPHPGAVRGV